MRYLIAYDIRDDDIRRDVAELLKDSGAVRIQYSAFEIECSPTLIEDLFNALRRMIGDEGKLIVIPICEKDQKRRVSMIVGAYRAERERMKEVIF